MLPSMPSPLLVAGLITAGVVISLVPLNLLAVGAFLRARRRLAFGRVGIMAWGVSLASPWAGVFAPLGAVLGMCLGVWAWRRSRAQPPTEEVADPLFWHQPSPGRGTPALPAQMAVFNGVGLLTVSLSIAMALWASAPLEVALA